MEDSKCAKGKVIQGVVSKGHQLDKRLVEMCNRWAKDKCSVVDSEEDIVEDVQDFKVHTRANLCKVLMARKEDNQECRLYRKALEDCKFQLVSVRARQPHRVNNCLRNHMSANASEERNCVILLKKPIAFPIMN